MQGLFKSKLEVESPAGSIQHHGSQNETLHPCLIFGSVGIHVLEILGISIHPRPWVSSAPLTLIGFIIHPILQPVSHCCVFRTRYIVFLVP